VGVGTRKGAVKSGGVRVGKESSFIKIGKMWFKYWKPQEGKGRNAQVGPTNKKRREKSTPKERHEMPHPRTDEY